MNEFQIKALKEQVKYNIEAIEMYSASKSYADIDIYDIVVRYNDNLIECQYIKVSQKPWDIKDLAEEITVAVKTYISKN